LQKNIAICSQNIAQNQTKAICQKQTPSNVQKQMQKWHCTHKPKQQKAKKNHAMICNKQLQNAHLHNIGIAKYKTCKSKALHWQAGTLAAIKTATLHQDSWQWHQNLQKIEIAKKKKTSKVKAKQKHITDVKKQNCKKK